jgi:hypothetical protein
MLGRVCTAKGEGGLARRKENPSATLPKHKQAAAFVLLYIPSMASCVISAGAETIAICIGAIFQFSLHTMMRDCTCRLFYFLQKTKTAAEAASGATITAPPIKYCDTFVGHLSSQPFVFICETARNLS